MQDPRPLRHLEIRRKCARGLLRSTTTLDAQTSPRMSESWEVFGHWHIRRAGKQATCLHCSGHHKPQDMFEISHSDGQREFRCYTHLLIPQQRTAKQ